MAATKELHFNAFYNSGPSQGWSGLWSHPNSNGTKYNRLDFWTDLAKLAERGLLDSIFIADGLGVAETYGGSPDAMIRAGAMCPAMDPMMVVSAMAAATEHLCFGITANTTYEPPYLLARRLSTLDHLTNGRIAWNVVTGSVPEAARAVGVELVPHDARYDQAEEYMDLVYRLWEASWEDGAAIRDRDRKVFADPAKVHKIHHESAHYRCDGMHLVEPSPQRTPLIFSAGGSGRGQAFAGRHAECTFIATNSIAKAKRMSAGFRQEARNAGRRPNDLKVFNLVTVVVAPTEAEAHDLAREYQRYISEEGMLAVYSNMIGVDLSAYPVDTPIEVVKNDTIQSIAEQMKVANGGKPVTTRDLTRFAGLGPIQAFIVGSPSQVCDQLIQWGDEGDLDGFNLARTVEPNGLNAFVDLVVPELQARGVYKTAYRGGSMREQLFPEIGGMLPDRHPAAGFRNVVKSPHVELV